MGWKESGHKIKLKKQFKNRSMLETLISKQAWILLHMEKIR